MKNALIARWSIGVMAVAALTLASPMHASPNDEKAVGEATAHFYSALNTMFTGEMGPMKDVWSHAPDVTYMGPGGGFQLGWEQVLAAWEEQAAKKLGGTVKAVGAQTTIAGGIAIVSNYEEGANIDPAGNPVKVSIRATNLFRREGGEWKMIGHHTDLLPFLEK